MRRDAATGALDPQGPVWGCPYRWGADLVLYAAERLARHGQTVRDWPDLLQPKLKQRIAFPTSARNFVGGWGRFGWRCEG